MQNLKDHPKLIILCQRTGYSKAEAIGYLHMFWWWVLEYAEDGDLSKFNGSMVVEGFKIQDLKDCGFIDNDEKVHDWFEFAGKYLTEKYRTRNPKKLKSIVKKWGRQRVSNCYGNSYSNCSRQIRLDKIRLDKKEKNTSLLLFNELWLKYPKRDGKKDALRHFGSSVQTEDDCKNIRIAIDNYIRYVDIKKIEYQFIKNGSTWFNNWRDWIQNPLKPIRPQAVESDEERIRVIAEIEMKAQGVK